MDETVKSPRLWQEEHIIANEEGEAHWEYDGNNHRNHPSGARCRWFFMESFSASNSNSAQGGGCLKYCGFSCNSGAQLEGED